MNSYFKPFGLFALMLSGCQSLYSAELIRGEDYILETNARQDGYDILLTAISDHPVCLGTYNWPAPAGYISYPHEQTVSLSSESEVIFMSYQRIDECLPCEIRLEAGKSLAGTIELKFFDLPPDSSSEDYTLFFDPKVWKCES